MAKDIGKDVNVQEGAAIVTHDPAKVKYTFKSTSPLDLSCGHSSLVTPVRSACDGNLDGSLETRLLGTQWM